MGKMAMQAQGPQASSTGGTTTEVPTGRVHKASANNPNQMKAPGAEPAVAAGGAAAPAANPFAGLGPQAAVPAGKKPAAAPMKKVAESRNGRYLRESTLTKSQRDFEKYVAKLGL
jgi:hypothetical protein